MKQLTIRGFDAQLERRLRGLAETRQISLNRAAILLMRRGAGLTEPGTAAPGDEAPRVGNALDGFMGVWSEGEAIDFLRSIESLEQVDPELWS